MSKSEKKLEKLSEDLKDLCHHYYLPFTNKKFDSAENIIEDFLKLQETRLSQSPLLYGIVPGFHLLEDFANWKNSPIDSYQVLTRINSIRDIFQIQEAWTKEDYKNNKGFSKNVIETLNGNGRNGRLKIIIKLDKEIDNIEITYFQVEKTIQYLIPLKLHSEWISQLEIPKSDTKNWLIDSLIKSSNKKLSKEPNIPNVNKAIFSGFSNKKHFNFKPLAKKIYNVAIKHSVYITSDKALLYLFSNNTSFDNGPLDDKDVGLGGMFILVDNSVVNLEYEKSRKIINYFSRLTDALASRLINFHQNEQIKRQATRAAVSQVMARNMSHNIGSHVLSKLVTKTAIDTLLRGENSTNQYRPFPGLNDKSEPKDEIALFNSYLRNRMDFLADIATGVPAMEVTRQLVRDIISGFDKNRILLNHISGVDNFAFEIDVRDCRKCPEHCYEEKCKLDGSNKDIPISIPNDVMGYHALYVIIENIIRNTAKHGGAPINSITKFILEIRNCNYNQSFYELIIYDSNSEIKTHHPYTLSNDEKEWYKNLLKQSLYHKQNNNIDELIPDELSHFDWLAIKQNHHINNSILDESNKLRHGAWGMVEMDVSAAYLRKIAPEDTDLSEFDVDIYHKNCHECCLDKVSKVNILKAVNKNNALGYKFHVMKPKEMIVVDENGSLWDELNQHYFDQEQKQTKLEKLREHGIWVLHTNFKLNNEWLFNKDEVYSHPFIIIIPEEKTFNLNSYLYKVIEVDSDTKTNKTIEVLNSNLPTRIIVCTNENVEQNRWVAYDTENKLCDALRNIDVEKPKENYAALVDNTIMDWAWKLWLKNKFDYFKISCTTGYINDNLSKYVDESLIIPNLDKQTLEIQMNDHTFSNCNFKKADYYEIYGHQTKELIEKKIILLEDNGVPNPLFDKIELYKLFDGVFSKILIIDERVQSESEKIFVENVTINSLLRKVNIIVPDPQKNEIDLNASVFTNNYLFEITKLIKNYLDQSKIIGFDFIVIHLGVIEKILQLIPPFTKNADDIVNFINVLNSVTGHCRIVITSGRGKPDNLPMNIPFIAYSILSQYCIENRFKSFLNQALHAARSIK